MRHNPFRLRAGAGLLCAVLALGALACDADTAPLFSVPGTGSLEGLVFLDADRDGRFDPSAGDRLLPNVHVRLLVRGTSSVIANGEAQTNASGRFQLANLPVGSHELAIDTAGVGAGVAFCQNPIPVDIYLNEPQFQQVAARGGCVITVAEAEQLAAGSPLTVRGTVISSPGQIVANRMYLQDNTGGIRAFNVTGGSVLVVGDVAEISGMLSFNAGETEIASGRLVDRVTGGAVPAPALTTTRAITDAGPTAADPLQGTLVVVRKAKVTQAWNNGTGSSRNAFINDGSGSTIVRIDTGTLFVSGTVDDLVARLNQIMGLNKCYDIVGIAASFNGDAELFPRTLSDITEVPCS